MDRDTETLVQRWIVAFCEGPVLVDPELMRPLLAEHDARGAPDPER